MVAFLLIENAVFLFVFSMHCFLWFYFYLGLLELPPLAFILLGKIAGRYSYVLRQVFAGGVR
jgi:hypothetical protein